MGRKQEALNEMEELIEENTGPNESNEFNYGYQKAMVDARDVIRDKWHERPPEAKAPGRR